MLTVQSSRGHVYTASARPNNRILLLDFDGVILRQKPVLQKVQQRIIDYVQLNVHKGYLHPEDAMRLNQDLYTRYGHTHIGMKKLFLPFSRLSDFNKFVYDPLFMNQLYMDAVRTTQVQEEMKDFKSWVKEFERTYDIPCYIFTNSPSHWCEQWLLRDTPGRTRVDGVVDIFGSNHSLFESHADSLLKPNLVLYSRIENHLLSKTHTEMCEDDSYCVKDGQLIFVDDSLANLEPVVHLRKWLPIWFGDTIQNHKDLHLQLKSLHDIDNILV